MYRVGDRVRILAVKDTQRTGQTGVIDSIESPFSYFNCRVKFPDDALFHVGELFFFSDIEPAKNQIVIDILNDL